MFLHLYFRFVYQSFNHLLTNFQALYFPNWQHNAKECPHCHQLNWYHSLIVKARILYLFQNHIQLRTKLDIVIVHSCPMILFFLLSNKKLRDFRLFFFKFLRKYLLVLITVCSNFWCIINRHWPTQPSSLVWKLILPRHLLLNPNHFFSCSLFLWLYR